MQAKAYARSNGSDHEKQNSDRSAIIAIPNNGMSVDYYCQQIHRCNLISYSTYELSVDIALHLMMGIIFLTNILLFILTLRYFYAVSEWIYTNEHTKNIIYKASTIAIVLLHVNSIAFLFDLYIISTANYDSKAQKIGLVFKLLSSALIPLLEFVWISINLYITFHPQKCSCALLSFGFCQVLWFAHRLLTDMIMSVVFFIIAPAQTIGIITLLLFTILCAIVFINQLFGIKCQRDKKTLSSLFCISVTGIVTVALVLMITLLFVTLVDNGLRSAGMGGFLLTIIPPIIALIVGVYINRQTLDSFYEWFRSTNKSESDSTTTDNEQVDATADGSINEGTHLLHT